MKIVRIFNFLVLLLVGTIMTSCYTTKLVSVQEDYNNAYIGATRATIKNTFGLPNRVIQDEDLGEILIYEKFYTKTTGTQRTSANAYNAGYLGVGANATINDYTTTTTERSFVEFYFDDYSDGCYRVKTNRTKEVKVKDEKTSKALAWGIPAGILGGTLILLIPFLIAR